LIFPAAQATTTTTDHTVATATPIAPSTMIAVIGKSVNEKMLSRRYRTFLRKPQPLVPASRGCRSYGTSNLRKPTQ